VGVWRVSDEALIASATVPGGRLAPLVESWRFVDLGTPSLLTANTTYRIAALETIPPDGIPVGGTFLTDPGIASASPGSVLSSTFTPTLTYPASSSPTVRVFANGDVTPAAVPEPSTLALAAMGGVGLLGYGWLRRKRARVPANREVLSFRPPAPPSPATPPSTMAAASRTSER
jgi:hypothetical protein